MTNYFALITDMHLAYADTATTTLYSVPILFDRNAHLVPRLVRVADIMWCAAGLSGLYSSSTIAPPTSVYSLPLELVDRVGGWDADAEAIGEDLHMYLKCFFALNGHLTTRTVMSPASQCNVSGGGKGFSGRVGDYGARYKQAMRHMWGALDSGFALRKAIVMWRNRRLRYRPLHVTRFVIISRFESSWLTIRYSGPEDRYLPDPDIEATLEQAPQYSGVFQDTIHGTLRSPHWIRLFYLLHRLFEAHFLPTHTVVLVISSSLYSLITADRPDSQGLGWIFALTGYLRVAGFVLMTFYFTLYEQYHQAGVSDRQAEMKAAGLASSMHGTFSYRTFRGNFFDYCIFPLVGLFYGSIPAVQAQMSHFYTINLDYKVSKKPVRLNVTSRGFHDGFVHD
jgi:hypothetical protein